MVQLILELISYVLVINNVIIQWIKKATNNAFNTWPISYTTTCVSVYGIKGTAIVSYLTNYTALNTQITGVHVNGGGFNLDIVSIGF